MRFYGFESHEIVTSEKGMLALDMDPKTAWALQHRAMFPVDINRAPKAILLRVPGLGVRNVQRILAARRVRAVRLDDLVHMRAPIQRMLPFIQLPDHHPGATLDAASLPARLSKISAAPQQLGLFI